MRIALVTVPQWDPRQPPLALPTLAAAVPAGTAAVKIFDLNLALYRNLLQSPDPDGPLSILVKRYLDPSSLADAHQFHCLSDKVQMFVNERFGTAGGHSLYWDSLRTPDSPSSAKAWRKALGSPEAFPALNLLQADIGDLLSWSPDWVLISVISDTQLLNALALASMLRRRAPVLRILVGGDALAYRRSILPGFPWLFDTIDAVGIGAGEPVLAALIAGGTPAELPNVLWRAADEAVHAGPQVLADLTRAGPVGWEETARLYYCPEIVIPVETARGCPWGRCAFCIHPDRSGGPGVAFREKPLETVMAEIEAAVRLGFRSFFFVDEAILPARLQAIATEILRRNLEIFWICYSRLDCRHSAEGLRLARRAGCRKIFFGFETGSGRLLQRFKKGITPEGQRQVLRLVGEAGIGVHLFLMTGFPGETRADQQATGEVLAEVLPFLDPFSFTYDLFPLWAERETDLFAAPEQYDAALLIDGDNDAAYQFRLTVPETDRLPFLRVEELLDDTVRRQFGNGFSLRDLRLSQDSLHLLLLLHR